MNVSMSTISYFVWKCSQTYIAISLSAWWHCTSHIITSITPFSQCLTVWTSLVILQVGFITKKEQINNLVKYLHSFSLIVEVFSFFFTLLKNFELLTIHVVMRDFETFRTEFIIANVALIIGVISIYDELSITMFRIWAIFYPS